MSVSIPYTFTGGTKARANEVNANFQAIAAKFTEGAGGIKNEDIAAGAGIVSGPSPGLSKLSTVAGSRITQIQMDDDAVDSRVLKDDATGGSPNAAVGNTNHIKDGIITNAKLVDNTIKRGKLNLASALVAIPGIAGNSFATVNTGLLSTTAFIVVFYAEGAGATDANARVINPNLRVDTGTNTFYFECVNLSAFATAGFNIRIYYLVI